MLRERRRNGIALCASRFVRAEALAFHRGDSGILSRSEARMGVQASPDSRLGSEVGGRQKRKTHPSEKRRVRHPTKFI
jgi:hypothetical protein